MKRTGLVSLVALAVVVVGAGFGAGAGCSGGAKAKPQPTLAEGEVAGDTGTPGAGERETAPPVDPTVVPDGTVATLSIGDPMTVLTDLSAYLTTAGFGGAPAAVATTAGMIGLSLEKPIAMVVVYGDMGPEPVIAGTATDEQTVQQFAQASGMSAEIENGIVVLARLEQQDRVGPHLRWRLGQPVPPEVRFEVASLYVNQMFAMASATMPNNPFAGFDSIAKLSGSMTFDANDATLKLVIDARAGTGLAKFAASLAPSDFRLAGIVASPGQKMFSAGTMDMRLLGDALRSWMGPAMDMWLAVTEHSDGSNAMALTSSGEMVSVVGLKPGAGAVAATAYEELIAKMATTPVVFMNTSSKGRARVKKFSKQWFHAVEASLTDAATDAERESMRRFWGGESTRSLVGVVDELAITVVENRGKADKTIADLLKRAKAKGAVAGAGAGAAAIGNPDAKAAVDEARKANEAVVLTGDLAAFFERVLEMAAGPDADPDSGGAKKGAAAKKPAPSPNRPSFRMGIGRVGESLGLRFVLPAPQVSAIRESVERMQATP